SANKEERKGLQKPKLKIVSLNSTAISLKWKTDDDDESTDGFTLLYRKSKDENWREKKLLPSETKHTLNNLDCGTLYIVSLSSFNSNGSSENTQLVARTNGGPPAAANMRDLFRAGSTTITINPDAIHDGGCAISKISVKFRNYGSREEYSSLYNDAYYPHRTITLQNARPSTAIEFIVRAENNAGSTEANYVVVTTAP
ncbi:Down syndrome cell adhesion molecule-like protein Dscam2, partial [Leptotrombidium deliense]